MPAAVVLIAQRFGWHWTQVALGGAGAHVIVAGLLLAVVRSRLARLHWFEESRNQLTKDREWLTPDPP
jgi:hypothetical protein